MNKITQAWADLRGLLNEANIFSDKRQHLQAQLTLLREAASYCEINNKQGVTGEELKELLRAEKFIDIYHWLVDRGYQDGEIVHVELPHPQDGTLADLHSARTVYVFRVADVKAGAFDEIYQRLPLANSIDVIRQMAYSDGSFQILKHLDSFLNNLPTRKP